MHLPGIMPLSFLSRSGSIGGIVTWAKRLLRGVEEGALWRAPPGGMSSPWRRWAPCPDARPCPLIPQIEILGREPEGGLVLEQIEFRLAYDLRPASWPKLRRCCLEPAPIGMGAASSSLTRAVFSKRTVSKVDGQHLAQGRADPFNDRLSSMAPQPFPNPSPPEG